MSQILKLQKLINEWAVRKEWRGPKAIKRPLVADLALFHSEISEALECLRLNNDPKAYWETYTVMHNGVKFKNITIQQALALDPQFSESDGKPEGVGPELADLLIRVFETAEEYGLDMDFEIERKMAYNEGREIRHGGLLL